MGYVAHHILPLVINSLRGGDTHRERHTCISTIHTGSILRNQAHRLVRAWFNKKIFSLVKFPTLCTVYYLIRKLPRCFLCVSQQLHISSHKSQTSFILPSNQSGGGYFCFTKTAFPFSSSNSPVLISIVSATNSYEVM